MGNAVFTNGVVGPRLELSHHPLFKGLTYNEYIGDAARKKVGAKKWNRRVARTIAAADIELVEEEQRVEYPNTLPGSRSILGRRAP